VEDQIEDNRCLQACINDLISVLALPAIWSGHKSSQIVTTLLDGLVGMLRLDFAYARLTDSIGEPLIESVRLAKHRNPATQPREVGQALSRWLTGDLPTSPLVVPNPVGEGKISIASFRLGLEDGIGVLVAGSERPDFPTKIELLHLRVAANQGAIWLQEARRLSEQRRAAEEFERQVAARTRQLTAANEELRKQINERERVEEEQRKLASLVENCTDFIGIASPAGKVLFVNPAGREIVGLDGDRQVRATRIFDFVVEEDRERIQRQVWPAVLREGLWDGETRFKHFQTGAAIPMLQHIFCIKGPRNNRPVAVATISRDITERKRAEGELRLAQAELAHASRVLTVGELTSSIAHEVNQPLGAIVTNGNAYLRLLSSDAQDLGEIREAVECMISDAMRASAVTKPIRALLKKTGTEKATLNISEMTQEVSALAAGELAKNQVRQHTKLEADLPPVLGDRIQWQQVLLNLILNGNEAMSAAGWEPRELLISSQESQPDQLLMKGRDTGTGLGSGDPERLFDTFFSTKEGGLGLGLSISRTIVETHGGRLWATPNEGQGATFQFSLPIKGDSGS